jgi:hypothetical protein
MSERKVIPNMPGKQRPMLNTDSIGYPPEVGDEEWNTKLKKLYTKTKGGWMRKLNT